ncbi:metal transporter CNNM4-like [Sycon ciliatum]|uniref:metal transporter CNNM4-like n=1 Tax=Sycon ciliatum TaxID=27933 RepID=UPI0031F68936
MDLCWWRGKSEMLSVLCAIAILLLAVCSAIPMALPEPGVLTRDGLGEQTPLSPAAGQQQGQNEELELDRHVRQTSTAVCKPQVTVIRFVQQGGVPAISTEEDGAVTVATFKDSEPRTGVLLELFGLCLDDVDSIVFPRPESKTCASRFGPYYPDPAQDQNSTVQRTFRLDLVDGREPDYNEVYHLCTGYEGDDAVDGLLRQGDLVKVKFLVTSSILPIWASALLVCVLLLFSGLFSGLNLGLMSLDPVELKVIMQSGTEAEKKYAKVIEPVRRHGNYLLCTILLGNVLVNATLTNLLDSLTGSGLVAVIASSGGIVVLGEIVPQSVCSRYGLAVGAKTIWLTRFFMIVTFPLAMPISWILDRILGREIGRVFKREELIKLVQVTRDHHDMAEDELEMLAGVLQFKNKTIAEVMTPKADMFLLADNTVLNFDTLRMIQKKGHSRIPVYCHGDESDIMGVLFVKDLMFVDPDENWPVSRIVKQYKHAVLRTVQDTKLDVMLEQFKSGVSHMSLVQRLINDCEGDPYYVTVGIVTLEDIIEEIIKTEIVDETDIVRDNITKEPVQRKPGRMLMWRCLCWTRLMVSTCPRTC